MSLGVLWFKMPVSPHLLMEGAGQLSLAVCGIVPVRQFLCSRPSSC